MKHFFLIFTILLPFYLSGQLRETFDGPEVAAAYSWSGDTERFRINAENELQLNGHAAGGEAKLYLSAIPLYDNEWHGKARSEYKGTVGNYFRFFLWCEKPDTEMPGEAIYVRMGYSKNNIALCYQRGNVVKKTLIEGRTLFREPREVEFKAVMDETGNCTLYSRCAGEEGFYEEGKASVPVSDGYGYYMIGVKYTSGHRKDKYIDDIYIKNRDISEYPGKEKPLALKDAEQENAEELLLHFNRPVMGDDAHFVLSGLGEANEIYQSEDGLILKPVWNKSREKGREYTLYYDALFDEEGNECEGEYTFISLYGGEGAEPEKPEPSVPGIIRINEVMADPNGLTELPPTEYVELHNTSAGTVSLDGWTFVYEDTRVALADFDFPAGGYLVLFREGREITIDKGGRMMPLVKFPSQLANTGKRLQLLDSSDSPVDEVTYGKAKAGKSWERSENGWALSKDRRGGTPGSLNSDPSDYPEKPEEPEEPGKPEDPSYPENTEVKPFDIVFNELLPNPYAGGSEYVELYNRSDEYRSLKGLSLAVRKADGTLATPCKLSGITTVLAPGEYAVLAKDDEGVYPYYRISSPENIYKVKLPVLNNNGSTLVLLQTADQLVIDEVTYSSKWHHSSVREEKGIALERIDPDGETQDESNWTSAAENAGYGTPGYQNSQYMKQQGGESTGINKPEYSHQTGLYSILYSLDRPGYRCRAFIYNISGQRVAEIANNELTGTNGELTWDGSGYQKSKLTPGLYIFYIELYHGKGIVRRYKEVFLVH
ncbi:MAG: lamin tail domain-containing protein [Tannerella sp.]|jgi:hypothetical protein|nr:lamin tail domain-containing protein [Tannerella sp.]